MLVRLIMQLEGHFTDQSSPKQRLLLGSSFCNVTPALGAGVPFDRSAVHGASEQILNMSRNRVSRHWI